MLHWWGLLSRFTFEVSQGTLLIWWAVCLGPSSLYALRHLLQEWEVCWMEGEPSSHSVHPLLRSPLSLEHCVSQTIWRWAFRFLFHLWHSCVYVCVHVCMVCPQLCGEARSPLVISVYLVYGDRAWSSPVYVFWLAREPQGPATFHLLNTGVQVGTTVFKTFTCGARTQVLLLAR